MLFAHKKATLPSYRQILRKILRKYSSSAQDTVNLNVKLYTYIYGVWNIVKFYAKFFTNI